MILFLFGRGSLGRGGTIWLASLARRKSSKSVVHQLASTAHIPTKLSQLANGTYRLVISRDIPPSHSSQYIKDLSALKSLDHKREPIICASRVSGILSPPPPPTKRYRTAQRRPAPLKDAVDQARGVRPQPSRRSSSSACCGGRKHRLRGLRRVTGERRESWSACSLQRGGSLGGTLVTREVCIVESVLVFSLTRVTLRL